MYHSNNQASIDIWDKFWHLNNINLNYRSDDLLFLLTNYNSRTQDDLILVAVSMLDVDNLYLSCYYYKRIIE